VYEWSSLLFMPGTYLKQTSPPYILLSVTCSLPCHTTVRLIAYRFVRKKVAMHAINRNVFTPALFHANATVWL